MPDKDARDAKEVEGGPAPELPPQPNPDVVEVTVRSLEDGHTLNLAVKLAQPDGTSLDQAVTTNTMTNTLVFRLKHLQEALVRAKVTHIATYDPAQATVTSKPLEEVYSPPAAPEAPPPEGGVMGRKEDDVVAHRATTHKTQDATHTARR